MALAVRRRTGAALHLQRFADLLSSWWRACFFFCSMPRLCFLCLHFFVALHVRFFFFFQLRVDSSLIRLAAINGHANSNVLPSHQSIFITAGYPLVLPFVFSLCLMFYVSVCATLFLSLSLSPRSASLSWVWTPGRATHSRPGFDGDATLWFASLAHHRLHYRNER